MRMRFHFGRDFSVNFQVMILKFKLEVYDHKGHLSWNFEYRRVKGGWDHKEFVFVILELILKNLINNFFFKLTLKERAAYYAAMFFYKIIKKKFF